MRISDWSSDVCSSDLAQGNSLITGTDTASEWVTSRTKRLQNITSRNTKLIIAVSSSVTIGRAPRRERVCQYVSIPVVAVSLKKTSISRLASLSYNDK